MSAAASPSSSSFCTLGSLPVRISENAVSRIVALSRREAGNILISSRPRSSSAASNRKPALGPASTRAGFAPTNMGATTGASPGSSVTLIERWCPSKRQPQARGRRRLAEDGGVVEPGIAARCVRHAGLGLHAAQDVFMLHDAAGREQSFRTQCRCEQWSQQFALGVVEFEQRHADAVHRNEVPHQALGRFERKAGRGAQIGGQGLEER